MNQNWLEFLQNQNAHIVDGRVSDFGDVQQELQAIDTGTVMADLSYYGLVEVTGEDASDFLQNQFTNDIRDVTAEYSQISNYCNPKGRILASFRLFQWNQHYYLRMPQDIIGAMIKRLSMFVLRSRVTIKDVSNTYSCMGAAGHDCATALKAAGITTLPAPANNVSGNSRLRVIRLPGDTERYEIHGQTSDVAELWILMKKQPITTVAFRAWQLYDIRAAIPEIDTATVEAFIPQMLNMQAIDGVSFTKGCYPGQEIVARTQYLGKVKRHMYKGRAVKSDVAAGDEIIASDSNDGQRNGIVVSAQVNANNETEFLAVIPENNITSPELHLLSASGPRVSLEALPYSLERSK